MRNFAERLTELAEVQFRAESSDISAAGAPVESVDAFNKLLDPDAATSSSARLLHNPPETELIPADWSLTLSKGARLKCSYHLNWPAELAPSSLGAAEDGLLIRFARLQTESDLDSTTRFYEKQLKTSAIIRPLENGFWIDALRQAEAGQIRSINLLITRLDSESPPRKGITEKLQLDVLCIELHDPLK